MRYKKKYDPMLHVAGSPVLKHNPLRVDDGYFEHFDERVLQRIENRRRHQRRWVVTLTATAAALTGFAFWLITANPGEASLNAVALSADTTPHLTGSYLTDQILADEIIEMAAGIDTLFLANGELWTDAGLDEIPDETIAEYLFWEGVSATEIAMAGN